jgi:hypothetical protein
MDLFSPNRTEIELDFSKIGESPFIQQCVILMRDGIVVQKITRAI